MTRPSIALRTPSQSKKGETSDKQQQNKTVIHPNKIRSTLITQVSKSIPEVFEAEDKSGPSSPHSIEQEIKTAEGYQIEDTNVRLTNLTDSSLFSDEWEPVSWSKNNVASPDAKSIPETISEKDSAQICNASTLAIVKERQQIIEKEIETENLPLKRAGSSSVDYTDFKATLVAPSHSNQHSVDKGCKAVEGQRKKGNWIT